MDVVQANQLRKQQRLARLRHDVRVNMETAIEALRYDRPHITLEKLNLVIDRVTLYLDNERRED